MKLGRHKELSKAYKVHELANNGMRTKDIAEAMDISLAMVQYYLRQELKGDEAAEARRKAISTCFWNADEETRIKVAELLHYDYKPAEKARETDISIVDAYKKISEKISLKEVAEETEEKSLLSRAIDFLNGKIEPSFIEENFSADEIELLKKSPRFVARFYCISWGINTTVTNEMAIEELKNMGIN